MTDATEETQLDDENPWPGLASFKENARTFFHGRDQDAASLLSYTLDAPATVLYGRSGLGKTSLLQAGLFPLLRDRHFLPVYVRFEIGENVPALTCQLHGAVHDSIQARVPDAALPSDEESLWEYLHRTDFELWSERNYLLTPLIVLDQFEELFTLGAKFPDRVREFMNDLGDLVENRISSGLVTRLENDDTLAERLHLQSQNYKVLISLREDFLPDLEGWRGLIPALGRSRMRLLPMGTDAAVEAVHKPAANLITKKQARRVVDILRGRDLHRGPDSATGDANRSDAELGASEVEPALLSLVCRELNEERKDRKLTHFDEQLIDLAESDILSNYYAKCVADMPRVAEFIESELITNKGFRNKYALEDAVPSHLTEEQLQGLIDSRLLRIEELYGAKRIELTHDVLTGVVREQRDRRRTEEEKVAEAERQVAREKQSRSRILRVLLALTTVLAVIAIAASAVAVLQRNQAVAGYRQATAARLLLDGQSMLAGQRPGGQVRALQEILAASALAPELAPGTLFYAAVAEGGTLTIFETTQNASAMAFSPDGHLIASGSVDHTVRLWNTATGQPVGARLTGHTGAVTSVAFSPDGHLIASGSVDHTVRLWDTATGEQVGAPLTGHTGAVTSVAFSPDGHLIASGSDDGTLRLWNADTGQPIVTLTGQTGAVTSVAFSPDGHLIASGGAGGTVRLWDAATGEQVGAPLTGQTGAVTSVAFSPDGHLIASGSNDGALRLWDTDTGQPVGQRITGHTGTVWSVAFSPDLKRILSGSQGGLVRVSPGPAAQLGEFETTQNASAMAFSPDGQRLASGSFDGTLRLWNTATDQPLGASLTGQTGAVTSVAFSPDGHLIASGSDDGTLRLWNADTGQPIATLTGQTGAVTSVAFSPDGHLIASGGAGGTVRLWDAATGEQVGAPLTGHTGAVTSVAFSPDGHLIASGSNDNTVRLWDTATGEEVGAPLTGHTGAVTSVAFSPDGHLIASSSVDNTVRLWNTASGHQPVGAPLIQTVAVTSVVFSPDGHLIASGSVDGTLRVWNANTGQTLGQPITGYTGPVWSVAFSPDEHRMLSGSQDGLVRVWPGPAAWQSVLCDKLATHMSHQQWKEWVSPSIPYVSVCPGLPIPPESG